MRERWANRWTRSASALLLSICMLACQGEPALEPGAPDPLRIGVLPDRSIPECERRYAPLLAYLSGVLGVETRLVVGASYRDLLGRFGAGEIDLALFGALTYVMAREKYGAVPVTMRKVDLHFTSLFITAAGEARSLQELGGESFAFGPRLSTSGHLMAREHLRRAGLKPESFFAEVRYTANHQETLALVREGTVAVGVLNSVLLRQMLRDGALAPSDIQIVAETPPYPNYVWTASEKLRPEARRQIRDAFMMLSQSDTAQAEVLDRLDASYYLPVSSERFDQTLEASAALFSEDQT